MQAPTIALVKAAITVPAKADIIAPVEVRPPKCKTCNARLRIDSGADKRANVFRTFNAAAVNASVEGVLADGEAAGDGDDINVLNLILYFSKK